MTSVNQSSSAEIFHPNFQANGRAYDAPLAPGLPGDARVWPIKNLDRGNLAFRYLDWLLTKNIPSGGFRLLFAITQRFTDESPFEAFPSIEYLAAYIRRRDSTVWEMLAKLAKCGAIEIALGSQGSRDPNVYRLPEEFLEFYFGPAKGRLPPIVLAPKKHRPAGVSKPRQAGVSNEPETPAQHAGNTGLTPGKPRQAGVNHLLATEGNTSVPSGTHTVLGDSQSEITEETTIISAPYGADANPVEREKLDMPAPTISEAPGEPLDPGCPAAAPKRPAMYGDLNIVAREHGCPPGTKIRPWLLERGLAEQIGGCWYLKTEIAA